MSYQCSSKGEVAHGDRRRSLRCIPTDIEMSPSARRLLPGMLFRRSVAKGTVEQVTSLPARLVVITRVRRRRRQGRSKSP